MSRTPRQGAAVERGEELAGWGGLEGQWCLLLRERDEILGLEEIKERRHVTARVEYSRTEVEVVALGDGPWAS